MKLLFNIVNLLLFSLKKCKLNAEKAITFYKFGFTFTFCQNQPFEDIRDLDVVRNENKIDTPALELINFIEAAFNSSPAFCLCW